MAIPIIIGVTGHRNLLRRDIPQLRQLIRAELTKWKEAYPHSPMVLLSAIAAGADQLCAEIALELGMELVCPLPMAVEEYRKDFSGEDRNTFDALLQKAREVFVAPPAEEAPGAPDRDFCYRQAGIYVAAHSHVLLALWDGNPGRPGGCGTAEAVDFMLRGTDFFKAANDGAVLHIRVNRETTAVPKPLEVRLLENQPGALEENLSMTETYNRDCAQLPPVEKTYRLLPPEVMSPVLARLEEAYHQADALSLGFQKRYLHSLRLFSVFSVLLVLTFLLYDEAGSRLMLMGYAGIILVYVAAFLSSQRSRAHEKYLQYRVLAESLRVQLYLSASGQSLNVAGSFAWTQKKESAWVKEALAALLVGAEEPRAVPDAVIKTHWIDGQLDYHRRALARNRPEYRADERLARGVFFLSLAVLAVILVLETLYPQVTGLPLFGEDFTVRSLMLVLLGVSSAGTAFQSDYFGKLSLERKCLDNEKMILLYSAAQQHFESGSVDSGALFRELAREELIENGNWFSYCKENRPTFDM